MTGFEPGTRVPVEISIFYLLAQRTKKLLRTKNKILKLKKLLINTILALHRPDYG